MKRILIVAGSLAAVILAASLTYLASPRLAPGRVDAARLLVAARTYADDLKARNVPVPAAVSLDELLARKLVTEAEVSGFDGMEVTVSLTANASRPQEILIRARMADGHEVVTLADGSVQSR